LLRGRFLATRAEPACLSHDAQQPIHALERRGGPRVERSARPLLLEMQTPRGEDFMVGHRFTDRRIKKTACVAIVAGAALLVVPVGCSDSGGRAPTGAEALGSTTSALYIAPNATPWPPGSATGSSQTTFIPVCWANGLDSTGGGNPTPATQDPNFATLQQWIWEALATGWSGEANLVFTGWGQCASNNEDYYAVGKLGPTIMIRWTTPAEASMGAGGLTDLGYISYRWTSMRLSNYYTEATFKAEVLHEFGHALSFDHEVDRPDNPNAIGCQRNTAYGGTYETAYDPESIMSWSYPCDLDPSDPDSTNGLLVDGFWVLSPGDIWGIQNVYGRKPQGALVNLNAGRCLSVPGASPQYGTHTDIWDCGAYPDQNWAGSGWELGSVQGPAYWNSPGNGVRCLDVAAFGTSDGTAAQSWECNGDSNQEWALPSVQIVGHGGNCLQWDGNSGVSMQACATWNTNSLQQWLYDQTRGRLMISGNLCLQAQGSGDGASVAVAACSTYAGQVWGLGMDGAGYITSFIDGAPHDSLDGPDVCLDVDGGGTANGTSVQIWQCLSRAKSPGVLGALNQRWALRGNLVGYGGNCLDVEGAGIGLGNTAWMWQCLAPAAAQQIWTYYF
jgi:Ricin-type beta-trefoil lectin domain